MGFLSKKSAFSEHKIEVTHTEKVDNRLDISVKYPQCPMTSGFTAVITAILGSLRIFTVRRNLLIYII